MKRLLILLAFAAIAAAGCAREAAVAPGEAPSTAETTIPAACALITEEEASEALGQPSKFRGVAADDGSNCIIDPVTGDSGISVDFRITEDVSAWQLEAANAETISGLGDVAVWNGSAIAAKKGDRYLIANVSRIGAPAGDLKTPATAFARKVVEKM
ncbi:MAG TPA: hypothetical protein VMS56_06070 [Thermoanaerobaculia bacterium]|nr:hypothetical protein [Thermoanaerobaculia bacterium]